MIRKIDLLSYVPDFLKPYREMEALQQGVQAEAQVLMDETEPLLNNQFILSADERGIALFEELLGERPRDNDTLETRRLRIFSIWNRFIPYTKVTLNEKLTALCQRDRYTLYFDGDKKVLTVRVSLKSRQHLSQVENLLEDMVPQAVEIDLSLLYNQHFFLARMPHFRLAELTCKQVREMVSDFKENGTYENLKHRQLKTYTQDSLRKGGY